MQPAPSRVVPITIGGKERRLRYTMHALMVVEEKLQRPLAAIGVDVQLGSITNITTMLWAGLLHEEPDLDLVEFSKSVDMADLEQAMKAIEEAQTVANGKEKKGPAKGKASAA
jgi:hypothetical protein